MGALRWCTCLKVFAIVSAELTLGSYSYRYLSSKISVTTDDPYTNPEPLYQELPDDGAYGTHSALNHLVGQLIEPQDLPDSENTIDAKFGCGDVPGQENINIVSKITYEVPTSSDVDYHWIALVSRGQCRFNQKIAFAHNQGASGILIYNQVGDSLVPMDYDKVDNFVAVMISFEDYLLVKPQVEEGAVWASIRAGQPVVNNSFERIVIATISVSFLILLALSVGWVIIYYFQRFRVMHRRYQAQKQRQDMAERAIKMIKTKKLKRSDQLISNQDSCAICIDEFEVGGVVMELPCKHSFHKKCIEPWIITKGTCPMCKVNIFEELGLQTREQVEEQRNQGGENHTLEAVTDGPGEAQTNRAFDATSESTTEQVSPSMVVTNLQGNDIHFEEVESQISEEDRVGVVASEGQSQDPEQDQIQAQDENVRTSSDPSVDEESGMASPSRQRPSSRPGSRSRFSEPDTENVSVVRLN